jgi:Ca2+/H+ antiporter
MNLLLSEFQVAAIVFAVVAVNNALNISPARWISGVKLIAIYLILGIGFYYQP